MQKLIDRVKAKEQAAYCELENRFKPLVIAWLKQTKELYQANVNDYASMAKVLLFESAMLYDKEKKVPFESYYKIRLWHWYANYKKKEKSICSLEVLPELLTAFDMDLKLEQQEKLDMIKSSIHCLNQSELLFLKNLCLGYKTSELSEQYGLSKKTILNKKYQLLKKIKEQIKKDH